MDTITLIKAELMLYALRNDYFGYGTIVQEYRTIVKKENCRYKVICNDEVDYLSKKDLANDFDNLTINDKENIYEMFKGELWDIVSQK